MRLAVTAAASALALFASAGVAQAACAYDTAQGLNTAGAGQSYPGADGRDWFMKKTPISVAGTRYTAYGLPREFGPMDLPVLERVGVFSGVMVFAEQEGDRDVVYVPVSAAACTFQPYQKEG